MLPWRLPIFMVVLELWPRALLADGPISLGSAATQRPGKNAPIASARRDLAGQHRQLQAVAALWDSSDHGKWGGESRFCCTGKRVGRGNTIPPLFGAPVP